MRAIRAVVYGAGAMGYLATRLMLEKGVEIVGAVARSPEKVGKDLGDLAGLGRKLNVTVHDDAEFVLKSTRPDIVLLATQSFLPEIREQLITCVTNNANVVTISEESLFPWSSSPAIAAEIDALAKEHGVTVTGTGHQDVFWVNMVSMLMGTAHSIESVSGRVSWNADDYGADIIASKHVGETLEQFHTAVSSEERPPGYGRNVLGALASVSGLVPLEWSSNIEPIVTSQDRFSMSMKKTLPAGCVVGYSDVDTMTTTDGTRFRFEMAGYVYEEGASDINEWSVRGEPDLELRNGHVPTQTTTCTQFVNRVPDVINASPGFVTIEQLPTLAYRPAPFHTYIRPGVLA